MKQYEKIYMVGDSHTIAYRGIKDVTECWLGPETMYSIGRGPEPFDFEGGRFDHYYIPKGLIDRDGIWMLCFGEIDCRGHVWKQINEQGRDEDEVLNSLVDNYFKSIDNSKHKDFGIVSVVPAIKYYSGEYDHSNFPKEWPVLGTDEERCRYVKKMNTLLKKKCEERDMPYLDSYSAHADEDGFLIKSLSDNNVHIYNSNRLPEVVANMNLIKTNI